jgi:hypothetical protein
MWPRRQPKPEVQDETEATPAGVDLANRYGYAAAAATNGSGPVRGSDIRRAYRTQFRTFLQRDEE